MPTLTLTTNVKVEDPKALVLDLSSFGGKLIDKPEKYMAVQYIHNPYFAWGGSFEPAFVLNISSLGNINRELNDSYSEPFFKFFKEKLGVEGNRGYIIFDDPGFSHMSHEGKTFATIFNK